MRAKVILLSLVLVISAMAGEQWFRLYKEGVEAVQNGKYKVAVAKLTAAIKAKDRETKKIRTYGMHFIEYYPHRELGIAYYNLGRKKLAFKHLKRSMRLAPTTRARSYLNKLAGIADDVEDEPPLAEKEAPKPVRKKEQAKKQSLKLVGERLGLAILPFENKGASRDLGDIVLDKMITALVNKERFKILERAQLEKILEEQQLGQTGIIDVNTAAQIGKGIGVDAMILGSVAVAQNGSVSIDARVIDTESAKIIVAQDAYSRSTSVQSVKEATQDLANKLTSNLPLLQGFVIQAQTDGKLMLDIGRQAGLRKGMKCIVYKEGKEIKHPVTGEVLGRETSIIAPIIVEEVYDKYAVARTVNSAAAAISVGDRFITK